MAKARRSALAVVIVTGLFVFSFAGCLTVGKKPYPQPVSQEPASPPLAKPAPSPPPPPGSKKPQPKKEVKGPSLSPPEPAYVEHVVRWPGETLSLISKWYTGKFSNWRAIAKANPALNPKRIRRGNIIKIPKELLRTYRPMPKSFVDKFYKKNEEEEPVLFGPKR